MYVSRAKATRCSPRLSVKSRSTPIEKKSKYASQNDAAIRTPSTAATITPAPRPVLLAPEPDRDERLADRDDQNQAVPLGEMPGWTRQPRTPTRIGATKPTATAASHSTGLRPLSTNAAATINAPPSERRASHPQHSRQQIRLGPPCHRKQPDEHDQHDQKRQSENEAMSAEGFRDCERGDKQRRGCDKHHRQHDPVIRVDRVRQPRIARPRPPQDRHNEQPATEPTPRRIIHQQGRHLREREHEHEVEEELGRRHPVVQLGVKLGHDATLTRTARDAKGAGSPARVRPGFGAKSERENLRKLRACLVSASLERRSWRRYVAHAPSAGRE